MSSLEFSEPLSVSGHLRKLRSVLVRSILVIVVLFVGLFPFAQKIYTFIAAPLRVFLPEGATMIATSVTSPLMAPIKLTMMIALFLAMPMILHQVWGLIAPAVYRQERRTAICMMIASVSLFYGGMAFAFYLVFPMMFGFFASVTPDGVEMMTDIGLYLDFILALFLAFGLAFQIPVATFLIIWAGITDVQTLSKSRPYVIVGCFVVGMLLTPPDVFSQTLLAVPMWMLFELGLLASRTISRPQQESESTQVL
ncbi:Sec-independent protein translocase subunit TatC [Paucimonas lemoignei]|nr:Sec-independent protein translocase subunit TatC [Paucimonas lemoignei]